MAALVKSLLDYSRLNKEIEKENVNLNEVLNDVRVDFELLIEDKHGAIESGPLPTVVANYMQLVQLFSNLIGNSLKFSAANPVIEISAAVVASEEITGAPRKLSECNYWRITVSDNGIGFDQQYSELIFTLFQRLHKKQEYGGTGIGLALCKKIAENHDGFITATAETGKGSVFNVYLPA